MNEFTTFNPEAIPPESLDARWYAEFETINSQNDVIKCLDGNPVSREEERQKFLSGETEHPVLDTNIDLGLVSKEETELLDLKERIISDEKKGVVLQAYRWRVNEKIAELRMLRASVECDMKRFKRYSEFVYGRPSPEIFDYTIAEVRSIMQKKSENQQDVQPIVQELDSLLPKNDGRSSTIKKPNQETVDAVKEIVDREWEGLGIKIEEDVETISDEDMSVIVTQALAEIGANHWGVIQDNERTGFYVSQSKEMVSVPMARSYSVKRMKELITHEIIKHVGRRVSGENSRLSLLGLGLDRYQMGEEGVTKIAENGVTGKASSFGTTERHLAIGLALGVDGKPRNFRQVFEILNKVYQLKQLHKGKTPEEAKKYADEWAWKHCVNVFRGTDCKTPGVAYTKDIVYREGSIAVWDIVKRDINEVYKFNIGKYDPANLRHLWILSQLEITDDALSSLESADKA